MGIRPTWRPDLWRFRDTSLGLGGGFDFALCFTGGYFGRAFYPRGCGEF
jgi:hypothetical protein